MGASSSHNLWNKLYNSADTDTLYGVGFNCRLWSSRIMSNCLREYSRTSFSVGNTACDRTLGIAQTRCMRQLPSCHSPRPSDAMAPRCWELPEDTRQNTMQCWMQWRCTYIGALRFIEGMSAENTFVHFRSFVTHFAHHIQNCFSVLAEQSMHVSNPTLNSDGKRTWKLLCDQGWSPCWCPPTTWV